METENHVYKGSSCEVSGGGMSMVIEAVKFQLNQECVVSFSLPQSSALNLRATVCWTKEHKNMVGTKFHLEQDGRIAVRKWIDDYLGIK
jgi:c-di-GMP-binding flagellar brake protein YcgR